MFSRQSLIDKSAGRFRRGGQGAILSGGAKMRRGTVVAWLILAVGFCSGRAVAEPVVPGAAVTVYATVTDPVSLAFDAAGYLYVGRDNAGSGGGNGDAVRIHRVSPGGSPVIEYGVSAVLDPDAVIVDVNGLFGDAGAVVVGGFVSNATGGHVTRILPDQSVVPLFGPTTGWHNPTWFVFDLDGRMLFSNFANPGTSPPGIYRSTGGSPTALILTTLNPRAIAVDSLNRIFITHTDGTIKLYDETGALLNGSFATGLGASAVLEIGTLGGSSESVFAIDAAGNLLRISMAGVVTTIGSGFVGQSWMRFGPDDALYVTEFPNDRVLRVSADNPSGRVPDGGDLPGTPLTVTHAAGSDLTLTWGPSCSAGDSEYAVYEGSLGSFTSHTPVLCSTGGATTATIAPGAGNHYYLVVPNNGLREGSYGVRSSGSQRPAAIAACLPQSHLRCQ